MTQANQNYMPTTLGAVSLQDLKEELDGLGSITLDSIKIPSGGAVTFELPSDTDEPIISKDLTGVIVYKHAVNSYWKNPYTGENIAPDCMANDGKNGVELATGECHECANCPLNQFGTKGVGKTCKNSMRLYILRENDTMPVVLNVPPSSLKNFKEFITKRVILRGKKLSSVITKISLQKAKSSGGIVYSQCTFSVDGELSQEQAENLKGLSDLCKSISQIMPQARTENNDNMIQDVSPQNQGFAETPIDFVDADTLN